MELLTLVNFIIKIQVKTHILPMVFTVIYDITVYLTVSLHVFNGEITVKELLQIFFVFLQFEIGYSKIHYNITHFNVK